MKVFKSALSGIAGAIIAVLLWVLVALVLPIELPMLMSRITGEGGASGAVITSDSMLLAALVGFAAGFYWRFRKPRGGPRLT
jgi:hypothetical protein